MSTDIVVNGNVSAPSAGTAVATTASLAHGRYKVIVQVHLEGSGTPAAADLDNMALYAGATEVGVVSVPEAKAVLFTSSEITVEVPASTALLVQAVGNATTAVVYSATIRVHVDAIFP